MSYVIKHKYFDAEGRVTITTVGDNAKVSYSISGNLDIRFPGKLQILKLANYSQHIYVEDPPGPVVHPPRWHTVPKTLHLTVEIKTPDGKPFTADQVTLSDLKRFRDLRGTSQGSWSFTIHGESDPIFIIPNETRVTPGNVHIRIVVEETVKSKSAPPLVKQILSTPDQQRFEFDLYRVGTFTATMKLGSSNTLAVGRKMELIDPDGVVVKRSNIGRLNYKVDLRTLNKSRDADGNVRTWSLHIPAVEHSGVHPITLWASVIATSTIYTSVLQKRIDTLIGTNGNKLLIYGDMKGSKILGRLKILDKATAETIDMRGLLDSVIESQEQDAGVDTNIEKGVAYTIASRSRVVKKYFHATLRNDVKINALRITIGASEKIQPSIPALKIEVEVQGYIEVDFEGILLGTAKVRGNRIYIEAGLDLNSNGTFYTKSWIDDELIDVDINWSNTLMLALLTAGLGGITAIVASEWVESDINGKITKSFNSVLDSVMCQIPHLLAVIHGDVFTYQSLRLDGDNIVFDYIAPREHEPKPNKEYLGVIGQALRPGPIYPRIIPSLGDTWKADNLAKIDHIVYVIMENRSFDHVLGYLAQLPGHETSNGLTADLITSLKDAGYNVGKLNLSGIKPNDWGYKTKFPAYVGHRLKDVVEQLSEQARTQLGKVINSPIGFLSNFEERALDHPELKKEDVLGYYEANDLPFFKFLVDNYSYCEKFFCSHPGPTLPNRMFSLTGDLQYDRTGEAIQDNNSSHDSNLYLSRATTIFDLLTRKGVTWRVYESFPSVTMLRLFARYASDDTNIVSIDRLQQDVNHGNLPSLTIVEPAMHHYPMNDDHAPHADMYNGQLFLKGIYSTLRSNEDLWKKTMLIITYDEHGGFYDHVIPPVADLRFRANDLPIEYNIPGGNPVNPQESQASGGPGTLLLTKYGLRVPTFIVSPWTVAGKGPDNVLDFCSVLKTIIARFCGQDKPFLSDRVKASQSLNSYLSGTAPRMDVPHPPSMRGRLPSDSLQRTLSIITEPISRKQMESGNVDYHELTGMLARMLGR